MGEIEVIAKDIKKPLFDLSDYFNIK